MVVGKANKAWSERERERERDKSTKKVFSLQRENGTPKNLTQNLELKSQFEWGHWNLKEQWISWFIKKQWELKPRMSNNNFVLCLTRSELRTACSACLPVCLPACFILEAYQGWTWWAPFKSMMEADDNRRRLEVEKLDPAERSQMCVCKSPSLNNVTKMCSEQTVLLLLFFVDKVGQKKFKCVIRVTMESIFSQSSVYSLSSQCLQ